MTAFLSVLDLLAGPIGRAGIDHAHLRAILHVKLLRDGRRRHGWAQGVGRVPPIVWSLGVHVLVGSWVAMIPFLVPSPLTALTIVHSVVMLMLAFDLVADYSAVLLDPADTALLTASPVTPRTRLAARIVHVAIYLGMYVGALALGSCVSGTVAYGALFLPVYVLTLVASVAMVLSGVTAVYLAIMRLASPARIADLVMWAQIVMTALTVGGYYALTTVTTMETLRIDHAGWIWAYPPAWLAGAVALVAGETGRTEVGLASLALVGPVVLSLAALRLAPAFRTERAPPPVRRTGRTSTAVPRRLARLLARGPEERGAFELLWVLVARDRQFKTRTYPSLAAIALFVVAFVLAAHEGAWSARIPNLAATDMHMFLLYYTLAVLPTPILTVPYVDRPDAAWIYRALPLTCPGIALMAGLKVLLVKLVVPVFAAVALAIVAFWGLRVLPDVLLASAAMLFASCTLSLRIGRRLPFAEPPPSGAAGTTAATMFGYMILVILAGAAHWVLAHLRTPLPQPWPLVSASALLLLGARAAARRYRATPWATLDTGA
jgi:hypothetical protein